MNTIHIAKSSIKSFIAINFLGIILTVSFTVLAIYLILSTAFKFGGLIPHGTVWTSIVTICLFKPVSIILTIITIILSIVLCFTFGNKYILKKVAYLIIADKGEQVVKTIIQQSILKVTSASPQLLEKGKSLMTFKEKFLDNLKASQENKWIKKIIILVTKKLQLDNESINNENVQEVISQKMLIEIQKLAQPSLKFFIPIVILQVVVLIILKLGIL